MGEEVLEGCVAVKSLGAELGSVGSRSEELLLLHMRADKLPMPTREFQFHEVRKWRFDFSWPELKLAVEVQGGVHMIRDRFHRDIQKRAHAIMAGWTVLEVDPESIRSGEAIAWLKALLWERAGL